MPIGHRFLDQYRRRRERWGRFGLILFVGGYVLSALQSWADIEFIVGKREGIVRVLTLILGVVLSPVALQVLEGVGARLSLGSTLSRDETLRSCLA
jgi:hypothetical protein